MAGENGRIRDSSVQSILALFISLASFYPDTNPLKHPRICVMFNNMSKNITANKKPVNFGDTSDEEQQMQGQDALKVARDDYRRRLTDDIYEFFDNTLSDETIVGGSTWGERKTEVCENEYQDEDWYKELLDED